MEAPLSLAPAIYPPFYAALFARPLIPPTGPSVLTARFTPCSLSLPLAPLSLVSFTRSSWLLLLLHPLVTPLLHGFPLYPTRFFSLASSHPQAAASPREFLTFLTAATAFIPSSSSPGRAYKGSPESNKSDNAERKRDSRVYTSRPPIITRHGY